MSDTVTEWPKDGGKADTWSWRRGLEKRIKILVVLLSVVSLLGCLGGWNWRLEILSHFIAWYALGSGLCALVLYLLRRYRWAVPATVLCLVQALQPLSWYLPGDNPPPGDGVPCRLLLANVLTSNQDTQSFLDLVEATNPDVICVQEINQRWATALEVLTDSYPVHHTVPRNDNFGIALYSRVSPETPTTVFEDIFSLPALTVPVEIDGARVELLSIHTLPPLNGTYAKTRNGQLGAARSWYEGQEGPAIIVGDLNLTMFSPIYRGWLFGLDLKNARQGHGPLGTFPNFAPFLRLPLDQCLVSPAIRVVDFQVGPDIGSDHLPIIVDLLLPH